MGHDSFLEPVQAIDAKPLRAAGARWQTQLRLAPTLRVEGLAVTASNLKCL